MPELFYLLTNAAIGYFHDHAHFVIPTLLAGHMVLQISRFPGLKYIFLFSRPFHHRAQCLSPIILPGSQDSVRLIFKACGPPKRWKLHTAHDLESSL